MASKEPTLEQVHIDGRVSPYFMVPKRNDGDLSLQGICIAHQMKKKPLEAIRHEPVPCHYQTKLQWDNVQGALDVLKTCQEDKWFMFQAIQETPEDDEDRCSTPTLANPYPNSPFIPIDQLASGSGFEALKSLVNQMDQLQDKFCLRVYPEKYDSPENQNGIKRSKKVVVLYTWTIFPANHSCQLSVVDLIPLFDVILIYLGDYFGYEYPIDSSRANLAHG